jgi:rhodanese-related sulfurtransferase
VFARLMGLRVISPHSLYDLVQQQAVTPIDVNARHSWLSARVPGAINLDPINYRETDLPADKESAVVFYCSNLLCRKAPNAARRARTFGYTNVHVMSAGISGWLAASLPTESGGEPSQLLRRSVASGSTSRSQCPASRDRHRSRRRRR